MKLQERRRTRSQQPVIKSRPQLQGQVNDHRLKDSESPLRRRGEGEKKTRIKEEHMESSSESTRTADREQDETEQKYYQHQAEEKRQKEQMTNPDPGVAEISAAEQRHHGDTVLSKKEPSGVSSTMPEQKKKKISRKPI